MLSFNSIISFLKFLESNIIDTPNDNGVTRINTGNINQNHGQYLISPVNSPTGITLKNDGQNQDKNVPIASFVFGPQI